METRLRWMDACWHCDDLCSLTINRHTLYIVCCDSIGHVPVICSKVITMAVFIQHVLYIPIFTCVCTFA